MIGLQESNNVCLCQSCTCTGCNEECFSDCYACGSPVTECNSYQTAGAKTLAQAHQQTSLQRSALGAKEAAMSEKIKKPVDVANIGEQKLSTNKNFYADYTPNTGDLQYVGIIYPRLTHEHTNCTISFTAGTQKYRFIAAIGTQFNPA